MVTPRRVRHDAPTRCHSLWGLQRQRRRHHDGDGVRASQPARHHARHDDSSGPVRGKRPATARQVRAERGSSARAPVATLPAADSAAPATATPMLALHWARPRLASSGIPQRIQTREPETGLSRPRLAPVRSLPSATGSQQSRCQSASRIGCVSFGAGPGGPMGNDPHSGTEASYRIHHDTRRIITDW